MVEEIKEEKNGTSNKQTVIWPFIITADIFCTSKEISNTRLSEVYGTIYRQL